MKYSRTTACISAAVLVAALLTAVFIFDQGQRHNKLAMHSQQVAMPSGCKQTNQEFVSGEFLPLDEILLRTYDCKDVDLTLDSAVKLFSQNGLTPQYPMLAESRYVLVGQKNSYYYKVSLKDADKKTQGSAKLATIRYYTGFSSF